MNPQLSQDKETQKTIAEINKRIEEHLYISWQTRLIYSFEYLLEFLLALPLYIGFVLAFPFLLIIMGLKT